jgi:SAM-dependent methyltransferase
MRHAHRVDQCPKLGVERTQRRYAATAESDPERPLANGPTPAAEWGPVSNGSLRRYYGSALGQGAMNTQEQWQLTLEAAELYERYPARYILGPWAPLLVDTARVTAGERVLDVACGTGVVTRAAAKRVGPTGRVVGIDLNPGMIAVAKSLPAPIGASIERLERSALDLRLENASFDVVLCQQGLQFFPDKLVALQEMRRVLDHRGRLALSVWNSNSIGLYTRPAILKFESYQAALSSL